MSLLSFLASVPPLTTLLHFCHNTISESESNFLLGKSPRTSMRYFPRKEREGSSERLRMGKKMREGGRVREREKREGEEREREREQVLFSEGDPGSSLFFVNEGGFVYIYIYIYIWHDYTRMDTISIFNVLLLVDKS
jgi:hypothetical protein